MAEKITFDIEVHSALNPIARLILAHGAGSGKEHEFMQDVAAALATRGVEVALFNFPYMQTINKTGKRRPPDKAEKLISHFNAVIDAFARGNMPECSAGLSESTRFSSEVLPTFIGGKSMGGRMASMVLENEDDETAAVKGAIVLGYPFHPPGKPDKTRTEHLLSQTRPMLIIQGERDTFGTQSEVEEYSLSSYIQCVYLEDGDHSFKPRKASGKTHKAHIVSAVEHAVAFIKQQL